ncbi:MAG: lamin tail domain-containing protein [Flavobacteriales bacterium]|nr:lamin tail domain-containing protein [Flavobacteriales bacterium]
MKRLLLSIIITGFTTLGFSQCTDLFISEYVEGWSNNKAIEIYNPTSAAINLSGYSLVRFRNQNTSPSNPVNLIGTLQPYDVYVVVLDKRDTAGIGFEAPVWDSLQVKADTFVNPAYNGGSETMYFNGNDAMAILSGGGVAVVDLMGKVGEVTPIDGWGLYGTDTAGNSLYITKDHTLRRKSWVQQGVLTSPSSFDPTVEWDSLWANTFDGLGQHYSTCDVTGIYDTRSEGRNKLWVYPSPAENGYFNIRTNNDIDHIELYNIMGQKILTESYSAIKTNRLSLSVDNVRPGAYFVSVTFENGDKITRQVILK